MEKSNKEFRRLLFFHLDGIALSSTLIALKNTSVIELLLADRSISLNDKNLKKFNKGYLNVALRVLQSQGLLEYSSRNSYSLTVYGQSILNNISLYNYFTEKIHILIELSNSKLTARGWQEYTALINEFNKHYKDLNPEICSKHIEGLLISPLLVYIGMNKASNLDFEKNNYIDYNYAKYIYRSLYELELIDSKNNITLKGSFFLKRSVAYGVTVSYLSTFNQIKTLLTGDPSKLWTRNKLGQETHVNRKMNVWGSGGSHKLYFQKIDEIVIDIFNQDINFQPSGIADMGCGDGTFLKHLYFLVINETLRGKHLDTHPLEIVGADFNQDAIEVSRENLDSKGINNKIIFGSINEPKAFAKSLKSKFNLDLSNMVSVRSFLDHNRIFEPTKAFKINRSIPKSTGAYSYRGKLIRSEEITFNLIKHFKNWQPYISKFGLIVLELHTIPPEVTFNNLGNTVATAYDATHGYSDQYIVEHDVFLNSAIEAGMIPVIDYQSLYPSENLATVSVNYFIS